MTGKTGELAVVQSSSPLPLHALCCSGLRAATEPLNAHKSAVVKIKNLAHHPKPIKTKP